MTMTILMIVVKHKKLEITNRDRSRKEICCKCKEEPKKMPNIKHEQKNARRCRIT